MRMYKLILLLLNWIFFVVIFDWTSVVQRDLLWWRDLNWDTWLIDLSGIVQLGVLPAGSLWILWLFTSCFFTVIYLLDLSLRTLASYIPSYQPEAVIEPELSPTPDFSVSEKSIIDAIAPETNSELIEKIKVLQQQLSRI